MLYKVRGSISMKGLQDVSDSIEAREKRDEIAQYRAPAPLRLHANDVKRYHVPSVVRGEAFLGFCARQRHQECARVGVD